MGGTMAAGRVWLGCLATILAVFAAKVVLSHPALFVWAVFAAVFTWALTATYHWFTWAERAVTSESVAFGLQMDRGLNSEATRLHLLLTESQIAGGVLPRARLRSVPSQRRSADAEWNDIARIIEVEAQTDGAS
jgi:hypothetical protein